MKNVSEESIAAWSGIKRGVFAKWRKKNLSKNADWTPDKKGRVIYTQSAIEKLLGAAILPKELDANSSPWADVMGDIVDTAKKEGPSEREFIVCKVPKNQRILLCREADGNGAALVRVKDNALFTPGMKIKARQLGSSLNYSGKMPCARGIIR